MSNRSKVLVKIAITIGLLAFLAFQMDLATFWEVLVSASPVLVMTAAILHLGSVLLSIVRWRAIMENFDIHVAFLPLSKITFIGYFFNIFLPSGIGGDFFRAYYLAKRKERGMSTTLTTTILERNAGMCALLIIGTICAAVRSVEVQGVPLLLVFLGVDAAYILANLILFHSWLHGCLAGFLERRGLDQLQEKMELVYRGLTSLRRNRASLATALLISLVIQFMTVVINWIGAQAIGIQAPFLVFLVFVPLINLSIMVPLTINGIGLRESLYFLLFSQIGVPVERAVGLSLVIFALYVVTAVPGAIVYSFYKKEEHLDEMLVEVETQ